VQIEVARIGRVVVDQNSQAELVETRSGHHRLRLDHDYLRTLKEVAMYLEAFFEAGIDHEALVHALGVVARARGGMSKLPKETGMSRQGLYKAIAKGCNPSFETVMKIVRTFGVRLSAQAT
jgi:probable addiction module antidote protein